MSVVQLFFRNLVDLIFGTIHRVNCLYFLYRYEECWRHRFHFHCQPVKCYLLCMFCYAQGLRV